MKIQNNFLRLTSACLLAVLMAVSAAAQVKTDNAAVLADFEKRLEKGLSAELEREMFSFVIANPKDARGFLLLATLRLKQDRLSEAKSLANKALTLEPESVNAKLTLAKIAFQSGDNQGSKAVLDTISDSQISDNTIRLNLVRALGLSGDCGRALTSAAKLPVRVQNAEALPTRAQCYLQAGDKKNFAAAQALAKALIKQNQNDAVEYASVVSRGGLHKEASEILRLVIAASPANTAALILLAKSEISLKDFTNAASHLAQTEKIAPDSAEILVTRSLLESEQGNNEKAFELLEKLLSIDSTNLRAIEQYIIVAIRANQARAATRAAQKLVALQPTNLEYLYLLGISSLQSNQIQQAEDALTRFLAARPDDSRGCLALGLTLAAQTDKISQARQQLERCLAADASNYEAAYQLGLSFKTQGDTAKAIEYFERTVKLSPGYGAVLRELGTAYLQMGAEAKARPVLEKAVQLLPNDADAHFQLSRLYNVIGERELAKKHLEIFQKLKNPKKEGM